MLIRLCFWFGSLSRRGFFGLELNSKLVKALLSIVGKWQMAVGVALLDSIWVEIEWVALVWVLQLFENGVVLLVEKEGVVLLVEREGVVLLWLRERYA